MPAKAPELDGALRARLRAVGAALRTRRKALGVTVVAAAEAAGISRVTWYRLEKGEAAATLGVYAKAAHVLGMPWPPAPEVREAGPTAPEPGEWVPVVVRVEDYPQLGKLAWQLNGRARLTAREALGIYERNQRHFDESTMPGHERALLGALRKVFAGNQDV